MKRKIGVPFLSLLFAFTAFILLSSWGIWGHQHINKSAVMAVPDKLGVFFYNHLDFITEESVVPDLRKYTLKDKAERPRHYINYESFDNGILDSIPKTYKAAYARYDDKSLQKNGMLPWYIQEVMDKLTKAMKDGRKTEILFLAADLGHYLGDANMPLHTSLNHDGQLTHQDGIHALWEAQLPEMYGDKYNFYTGDAHFIEDINKETWRIILNSHQVADTLLATEKKLRTSMTEDKIFMKDTNGKLMKNKFNDVIFTQEYDNLFNDALHGMVQRQLRLAISATANYWYTAWVNAGKPDLSLLDAEGLTNRNYKNYKKDKKAWLKGQLTNIKTEVEF